MILHLFLHLSFLSAWAAAPTPVQTQKQDLQMIQKEVKRLETSIKSGRETEASLAVELSKLEKLLRLQALEIQLSTIELEKLEDHVQEMTIRRDSLQQSIELKKHRLRQLLSYLPTLETRLPISSLTEDDEVYLIQYRELVGRLLKEDKVEILALKKILDEVQSLNAKLADDKERLLAHAEDLKEKQAVLTLNQKMRVDLLKKTRSEQKDRLKVYQAAKSAEGELESVLSRFHDKIESRSVTEAIATIEPSSKSGGSFLAKKGALTLPSEGKIVTAFGRKYDSKSSLYTFHKGIDIQTRPEAPVKSVYAGKIVFSGTIGGYGQLLIIDHGDQYFSLVGHLGEAKKKAIMCAKANRSARQHSTIHLFILKFVSGISRLIRYRGWPTPKSIKLGFHKFATASLFAFAPRSNAQ